MAIQSVIVKNFRSYESYAVEFQPGVTIIVGPNASGKTNLLESVYMLAQGSSFRVSDKDLVRRSSNWARLDGVFDTQERVLKLQLGEPKTKKTFVIDESIHSRLSFNQTVPVVLFEPDDIRLIGGSPERRRSFLNDLLSQTVPTYKKALSSYSRVLKQRNTLLKNHSDSSSLFAWNVIMARAAEELVVSRTKAVEEINTRISDIYGSIADKTHTISMEYKTQVVSENYMNALVRRLEHSVAVDRIRGFTSVGPHRDDLVIAINGNAADISASRGEARTITLALKIIEVDMIKSIRSSAPILLLDDVFSELDGVRRKMLTHFLSDHQAIITTTDADVVGKKFTQLAEFISL
jgi:DNA replication and repair protein RecF